MTERTEITAMPFDAIAARRQRDEVRRREQARAAALALLHANDSDPHHYIAAARACKQSGRVQEALDILGLGIRRCAPATPLYEYFVERLEKCNRTEEAAAVAREAMALFPDEWIFRLREALILPIFYESRGQIDRWRRRYSDNLRRLVAELPLDTPVARQRALVAIGKNNNKYLPYQGGNDRELQSVYGQWVQAIVAAQGPHEAGGSRATTLLPGKLRVGFLTASSARFEHLSAATLFGGWIRHLDCARFEVFAYHGDNLAAGSQRTIRHWNIPFRQLSGDLTENARAVRGDRLHALVYLDFGMHPRMAQLAALRLAPVQAVAWDTPLTSGIPSMDCFLTSDLMEPSDAADHYSEEIVRLPGIGVCVDKPVIPTAILRKRRSDFGLRDQAIVYLCCQSIFKYSPEQDELIAHIARRIPNSQFAFLVTNDVVGADFRSRVRRTFEALGLPSEHYCVWLPEMDQVDYWNLLCVGDVALDTLGWSGGVTTLEALACGLPVVTLPGRWMRGRHSLAILTQLGIRETIARDEADYVDIAVRLGADLHWRQAIVDRSKAHWPRLYSDTRSVRALEAFMTEIVSGNRSRSGRIERFS